MSDNELKNASQFRTKNRLPVLSYYYNKNSNLKGTPSIWRSSQNKTGFLGKKNEDDVKLLNCIVNLCSKLFIFDCRPYMNAMANSVIGGGFEKKKHYKNVELSFCEIDNIHKARNSLNSIYSLSFNEKINENEKFYTNFENTNWLDFIYLLLKNAHNVSQVLQQNNSVLIHCSDGWDRSSQLITLSQILIDPYYRTIVGFAVLIEKDWLSFGHQFAKRNGFYYDKVDEDQRSPIFLQFLDCVHQLILQFPNSFEFNEDFLLFLAKYHTTN